MKFGQVPDPENVNFNLPATAKETGQILKQAVGLPFEVYVGCAKWNRKDLKGFYPKGVKDELSYYANRFNAIELNATFYKMPDWKQVETWKQKTPPGFKFFPKLTNLISHYKRLIDVEQPVEIFCDAISPFGDRLGMAFLQLHDNFQPKDFDRLEKVLTHFPQAIPLAVEVRNAAWFNNREILEKYARLLEKTEMTNIIVDTAGRRDLLHLRLSNPVAFIRFVGANHPIDKPRLESWVDRIEQWRRQGLQKLCFFIHQHNEESSPLLANHFIKMMNERFDLSMTIPHAV